MTPARRPRSAGGWGRRSPCASSPDWSATSCSIRRPGWPTTSRAARRGDTGSPRACTSPPASRPSVAAGQAVGRISTAVRLAATAVGQARPGAAVDRGAGGRIRLRAGDGTAEHGPVVPVAVLVRAGALRRGVAGRRGAGAASRGQGPGDPGALEPAVARDARPARTRRARPAVPAGRGGRRGRGRHADHRGPVLHPAEGPHPVRTASPGPGPTGPARQPDGCRGRRRPDRRRGVPPGGGRSAAVHPDAGRTPRPAAARGGAADRLCGGLEQVGALDGGCGSWTCWSGRARRTRGCG